LPDLSLKLSQREVLDFSGEVQKFSGEVHTSLQNPAMCISKHLFTSKLQRRKFGLLIQIRFLNKYFQSYKQAVGKFALNFSLTKS
jgi:hypothetical protein